MHCDLWEGFSEIAVHQGKDGLKREATGDNGDFLALVNNVLQALIFYNFSPFGFFYCY